MSDLELIALGLAAGVGGLIGWRALQPPAIDPTTGGVPLPAGTVYGPPVPDTSGNVVSGPVVEGLN